MEAIIERCCGIDVHKKTIVACLMVGKPDEKVKTTIKTFSTMTRDLLACKDWLESKAAPMLHWRVVVFTGNLYLISLKIVWRLSLPMQGTSKMFPDERPMLKTVNGSLNSCVMDLSIEVLFHQNLFVSCVILPAIARN